MGEVDGNTEAEVAGDGGHRRDQQQGIEEWHLHRLAQRRRGIAAQHVVDAKHIGQEQPIEQAALQGPGKLGPVAEAVIFRRAVAGMRPHPVLNMADRRHVEGVQAEFTRHPPVSRRHAARSMPGGAPGIVGPGDGPASPNRGPRRLRLR